MALCYLCNVTITITKWTMYMWTRYHWAVQVGGFTGGRWKVVNAVNAHSDQSQCLCLWELSTEFPDGSQHWIILMWLNVILAKLTSRQCWSAAIACNHVIPCPWDSAQHISCHLLSLGVHYELPADRSQSFPLPPLSLVSMLCSSPLIISVTGILVVDCAGLPWLLSWTLGSAWRFPHQGPSPQPHLGDEVNKIFSYFTESELQLWWKVWFTWREVPSQLAWCGPLLFPHGMSGPSQSDLRSSMIQQPWLRWLPCDCWWLLSPHHGQAVWQLQSLFWKWMGHKICSYQWNITHSPSAPPLPPPTWQYPPSSLFSRIVHNLNNIN